MRECSGSVIPPTWKGCHCSVRQARETDVRAWCLPGASGLAASQRRCGVVSAVCVCGPQMSGLAAGERRTVSDESPPWRGLGGGGRRRRRIEQRSGLRPACGWYQCLLSNSRVCAAFSADAAAPACATVNIRVHLVNMAARGSSRAPSGGACPALSYAALYRLLGRIRTVNRGGSRARSVCGEAAFDCKLLSIEVR
jgi:hypothetical protein